MNHNAKVFFRISRIGGWLARKNTAESSFAWLERRHNGILHQLLRRHLPRYTNEFAFRWNSRTLTGGERIVPAINGMEGNWPECR
ncbi:MAG: hypothetical protein DCC68_11560 [Planctomycetota bacterium]|nr:MAG: hypothetical protein DCC68_11560 [Planctomycetota bacterium]